MEQQSEVIETEAVEADAEIEDEGDERGDEGSDLRDEDEEGLQDDEGEEGEDADADAEGADDEDEGEDEEVEIDFGGTKERFKKGTPIEQVQERVNEFVKSTYSDYITKTQRVAESRKLVETQEEGLQQLASMGDEYYQAYGTALRLQQERQQLASVDVSQLWATNPDQARQVSDALTQRNMELARLSDRMAQTETQMKAAQEGARAKAAEAGRKALDARIPGFSDKHANSVVEYVMQRYNIPHETAANWAVSPDVTEMAYKAMLYDKSKATVGKKSPPKPIGKLLSPVRGKGAAPRRSDHLDPKQAEGMSADAWIKAENRRLERLSRRK